MYEPSFALVLEPSEHAFPLMLPFLNGFGDTLQGNVSNPCVSSNHPVIAMERPNITLHGACPVFLQVMDASFLGTAPKAAAYLASVYALPQLCEAYSWKAEPAEAVVTLETSAAMLKDSESWGARPQRCLSGKWTAGLVRQTFIDFFATKVNSRRASCRCPCLNPSTAPATCSVLPLALPSRCSFLITMSTSHSLALLLPSSRAFQCRSVSLATPCRTTPFGPHHQWCHTTTQPCCSPMRV